ncbi:hypothetical protein ACTQ1O_05630 [Bilifractor sp. LCP21S3_A7]
METLVMILRWAGALALAWLCGKLITKIAATRETGGSVRAISPCC